MSNPGCEILYRVRNYRAGYRPDEFSTFSQLLERQKSAPTGTFHHTRRPWQVQQNQVLKIQVSSEAQSNSYDRELHSVDRFFFVQHTKTGENIPNDDKIFPMAVK
jgi:hypothetical protein